MKVSKLYNFDCKMFHRDKKYNLLTMLSSNYDANIEHFDLTKKFKFPDIYDQGKIGSCTANASAHLFLYCILNNKVENINDMPFKPSRMYIYNKARMLYGQDLANDGTTITSIIQSIKENGVCEENLFKYEMSNKTIIPNEKCNTNATFHKIINATNIIATLDNIKMYLQETNPIICAFTVFESIDNVKSDGIIQMPDFKGEKIIGGHAVMLVGYDDKKKLFKFLNSWGSKWGDNGYGYIPYDYLLNQSYSSDYWIVTMIKNEKDVNFIDTQQCCVCF